MSRLIFTIVAKNYFASALALRESVQRTDPESEFVIILADEVLDTESALFAGHHYLEARKLGIPQFETLAFKYDVVEFCTCLKPFAIRYFLSRGSSKVVYFDPDILVWTSIQQIWDLLDFHSVVVTPHILEGCGQPISSEKEIDNEKRLMASGVFNLGFVAFNASNDADHLLRWWSDRLSVSCYIDRKNSLFTDQKWVDLFPCLSSRVAILRDPSFNVAWWNFSERTIVAQYDGWYVEGSTGPAKIVFFHFSGFRPGSPETITKLPADTLGRSANSIQAIFSAYAETLQRYKFEKYRTLRYGYSEFLDMTPILPIHRRLFRALQLEGRTFDNPFEVEGETFHRLLEKSRLLTTSRKGKGNRGGGVDYTDGRKQGIEQLVNKLLKVALILLGVERYALMVSFFSGRVTVDQQTHLLSSRDRSKRVSKTLVD